MSKWLKIDIQCLRQKCSPKNLVFSDISLNDDICRGYGGQVHY